MGSGLSERTGLTPVKIVVAGGFGVGKTTFVGAISEIEPLRSEAIITDASAGIDELYPDGTKTETTVAMDFGRISLKHRLVLYLFGTPGQDRFHFMWDELARGAIGAVVLVDTRRIEACFAALVSSEEVPRGKPAPDVFLEAARRLGVDPAHCAAVEDSSAAVRSRNSDSSIGSGPNCRVNRASRPGSNCAAMFTRGPCPR